MGRHLLSAFAFGSCYFAVAAIPIAVTRFEGGVAMVWAASALLVAKLHSSALKEWRAAIMAALAGSILATGIFGLGWLAAGPLSIVNVSEAVLVAHLYRKVDWRGANTSTSIGAFLLLACIIGPAVTAMPGAMVASFASGTPFLANLKNWLIGHSLGMLTFAPVCLHLLRGSISTWVRITLRRSNYVDFGLLILALTATVATFVQTAYPLLFLPVLVLVAFVYRAGYPGAALGTASLGLIGGFLTTRGLGPLALMHGAPAEATRFFQIYLAATQLTLLPVAASLSSRAETSLRLRQSEARYRILADNINDIVMSVDFAGRFTYVSPSMRNYVSAPPESLIGTPAIDLIHPDFHDIARACHQRMLCSRGFPVVFEYVGMTEDGLERWFETSGRAALDRHGMPVSVVATIRETTARKQLEREMSEAAKTDTLTRLPNRRAFFEFADAALCSGAAGCVALIDLDHFKLVNDRYGHAAGDRVLQEVAAIAQGALRTGDIFARFGGEEFALLLPGASLEQARGICNRLIELIARNRVNWNNSIFSVTASAGVAALHEHIDDALNNADTALYEAKRFGRAQVALAA